MKSREVPHCKICGHIFPDPYDISGIKKHMNSHPEFRKELDYIFRDYERQQEQKTKESLR